MDTFDEVHIGNLVLPNRLLMAPIKTGFGGPDGTVSDQLLAYYRRRAEGGVGAIVVEPLYVDAGGKEHPRQLAIDTQETVEGLRRLTDTIHEGGAKAVAHLNHGGRASNPKVIGQPPEAPSEIACPTTGGVPRILRKTRIKELVKAFVASARRAQEAGFDSVEIQCGLGYLIAQFLSERTNQRTDEYGGGRDRRHRFAHEVIDGVIDATNGSFPIIARISASEQLEGGLNIDDGIHLAQRLVDWGVSAIHVVTGSVCDTPPWYFQHMGLPDGVNEKFAAQIKSNTGVATIVAGRLGDPERIDQIIREGQVDMVALGRPLVADPDLPRKMTEDRTDEIIFCGSCLQGCLASVKAGKGLSCIVNAEVGRDGEIETPSEKERHVVIVGGGPAGLTAAVVARRRGHRVTLLERDQLGGQFSLAPLAPGKAAMARPLNSLVKQASRSGATIETGVEANTDLVEALKPDVVVLATGGDPTLIPVDGLQGALTSRDVLTETKETGSSVLVVGGGTVGIEVAEFLATKGKRVTVIEVLGEIARDMLPITRKLTLNRLQSLPVEILTETVLKRIDAGQATVRRLDRNQNIGPFDSVVLAVGTTSNDELLKPLQARGLNVQVVGDAADPGQIIGAVRSGSAVACSI